MVGDVRERREREGGGRVGREIRREGRREGGGERKRIWVAGM